MPAKGGLPVAKQDAILAYLRKSRTVHSIKELEKVLPSVASINGMQVKDYLQALQDENLIRVEKIGSGNWYWSFISEEIKEKTSALEKLEAEKVKLQSYIESSKRRLDEAQMGEADQIRHSELLTSLAEEQSTLTTLQTELDGYRDSDPVELEKKRTETELFRKEAEAWTSNILILEDKLKQLLGGDKGQLEDIKRQCYGREYIEGEGLQEWE